jgi:hypothetical protein
MRRNGVWDKARGVAERWLKEAAPADQVAVMAFDRQVRTVVGFEEWSSWADGDRAVLARQRLAVLAPGWMGTRLGTALVAAAGQFPNASDAAAPPKSRAVVLISDLQEGAKLDGLQGHDWPADVRVILERVDGGPESNAGLEVLDPAAAAAAAGEVPVRVSNSSNSRKEKFSLAWSGVAGAATEIYLPPGQSRTVAAPKLSAGVTTGRLVLTGDDVDFDNTSYFATPEAEEVAIACMGTGSTNDPAALRYYLQRVFPPSPRRRVELVGADSLPRTAFAIVSGKLPPEQGAAVHNWLAAGKSGLLVLGGADAAPTLAALLGVPEATLSEADGDFALLGHIDFRHPIFAPFDDPRFSDFSHIHFWKHRRWTVPPGLQASVIAEFDDGSPALAQVPVGKGRLLILASGWNPSDSQLAVSSKFPPLMQTLLEWSGSTVPVHSQLRTGDAIPSPVAAAVAVQWQRPDGKAESLLAGEAYMDTDVPGIYQATWAGGHRQFAVNLPVEESRIAPMPVDELARLGVPLGPVTEPAAALVRLHQHELARTELENRQKIWRWLLAAALAVTLLEITLSGWWSRRQTAPEAIA